MSLPTSVDQVNSRCQSSIPESLIVSQIFFAGHRGWSAAEEVVSAPSPLPLSPALGASCGTSHENSGGEGSEVLAL